MGRRFPPPSSFRELLKRNSASRPSVCVPEVLFKGNRVMWNLQHGAQVMGKDL